MAGLAFEWDEAKDASNRAKHGVSFGEASTVFTDPRALVIDDPDHSIVEERFIIMGMSGTMRVLVVAHCYRERQGIIRLISARKATTRETQTYGQGRRGD
ncbi:MAG: BrnT family toxin [Ruaniaceae bacterium]|nr:BrnT family toxin [Ruaniaceae bacterium]